MSEARRYVRVVLVGWLTAVKKLTHSEFFILVSILQPVIFASIAFFMFRAGGREGSLLYAALGAGLMGIWSSVLFGSGGLIQWERYEGTLELLVAAPAPLSATVFASTLATATIGCYSVAATLFWGIVFFGIPLRVAEPLAFLAALPVTVLGLGMLGLMLASTFILYRSANAMSNLLEYPVWLVTGLLVPVSLLPGWTEPIGWVLAPTWGIRAIRGAALGTEGALVPTLVTLCLGAAYLVLGSFFLGHFERLARERAALSLT